MYQHFTNISLSGNFKTLSKLVMMVVMLRGRHRGLPMAVSLTILKRSRLTSSLIGPFCCLPISTRLKMKSRTRIGLAAHLTSTPRHRRYMLVHRLALSMATVQGLKVQVCGVLA